MFDVVSISFALHHLTKVSKGLREMKRVVKTGGWIIVNEIISDNLNSAQEVHKMYHHFRSSIDRILGVIHHETFKKDQVIQMVENAGISIQFFFENNSGPVINEVAEIMKRAEVMQNMLEEIKGKSEYNEMKDQITQFRNLGKINGIQQASTVVVVGRKIR
jgi:ubiquinone/menaquinone biosynthesis C-methylase UbiE